MSTSYPKRKGAASRSRPRNTANRTVAGIVRDKGPLPPLQLALSGPHASLRALLLRSSAVLAAGEPGSISEISRYNLERAVSTFLEEVRLTGLPTGYSGDIFTRQASREASGPGSDEQVARDRKAAQKRIQLRLDAKYIKENS